MAEPDDLLGKADALMARHFPGRIPAEPYAGIPVLDEVVDVIPDGDDLPLLTEYVLPAPADAKQPKAVAESVSATLLAGMQPEIDALIEARLKDGLEPLIERLFADLRGDLQLMAHEVLGDAIRAAVEHELERRK